MTNDPADKLAAPSFGFKKKRGGTKPTDAKPEKSSAQQGSAEKTQVLEKTAAPVVSPEPPAKKAVAKPAQKQKAPKPVREPKAKAPRTPKAPKEPKAPSQRRLKLATPTGMSAAVMIGAIVGAFMTLAIWFSGTVSQWTRGTSSLGDKGAIILITVFVLAVVVGGYLLRLASARSPFTISFLGSALVAVVSMLFLTELFDHAWGVIVAVILTAAAYALSYWVTTTYID
ncbi:hypothetical protein [Nocardioides albus]|uniref:Uncharacterized protein n=1 Tax=Nocardioides albus TaxID=1841 RepID=A0A7W5A206_9ACTN|nr:hypothetical protein [Nocardioides albus]MBB3088202.1 hypothetical protein [Nocardioides albus]GGU23164.1 hypothetical protein GCM10007979_22690 [Nocardioides albus]